MSGVLILIAVVEAIRLLIDIGRILMDVANDAVMYGDKERDASVIRDIGSDVSDIKHIIKGDRDDGR